MGEERMTPASGAPTDRALVGLVLDGDMSAFTPLYARHVRTVAMAVRDNVHDPESVADVVQEVFARALERLGSLRDHDRFGPWLLSIARHAAIDNRRWRDKHRTVVDHVDLPAPGPGPEALAETAELAELVGSCVSGLSARDATALTLVLQLGLEPSDIATCLGVTTGAAKVIVHRARRRLRDALAVEILGRRRAEGCTELGVLLDSGDVTAARRHVRECACCTDLVAAEMALYRSSGALVSA
jgi:RNA polymerase sigma factor (sigma-70 family)